MRALKSPILLLVVYCWSSVFVDCCPSQCRCRPAQGQGRGAAVIADCSNAGLTSIPKLPRDIEELDLSGNALRQITNDSFTSTPYLQDLNLSSNDLSGIEINAFASLPALMKLNLSNNKLTESNFQNHELFRGCRQVTELDLSYNLLINLPSNGFKVLTNLKKLHITNNLISNPTFGPTYVSLDVLEYVDLSGNSFSEIPSQAFRVLRHIKTINISSCEIRTVKSDVFDNLNALVNFDISNNPGIRQTDLNNTIKVVARASHLTSLKLSNVNMSDLSYVLQPLVDAENLNYLDMSHNSLRSISAADIRPTAMLRHLDLSYNKLMGLPVLASQHLRLLDASHNNIASISEQNFERALALKEVDLSYNRLTEFKSNPFSRNSEMTKIDMSFNNIVTVHQIGHLESLTELILRGNSIVDPTNLFSMYGLLTLDLGLNKIKYLNRTLITERIDLTHLNLTQNEIGSVEVDTFRVWNPTVIDLSNNKITNINDWGLGLVQELYLQNNLINYIRDTALSNMNFLGKLDLSSNRLASLPTAFFKMLDDLLWIDLSHNNLGDFLQGSQGSSAAFAGSNLQTLILKANNIKFIPSYFANITKLIHLDLGENQIDDVTSRQLQNLDILKTLNLSYNKLTGFNSSIIKPLVSLSSLDLSGTQWQCDCSLEDVKKWMESTVDLDIVNYEQYSCTGPSSRVDLLLKDFNIEDLECDTSTVMEKTIILIIIGCTSFVILVVAAIIFWQHRWRLKKKLKKQHYRAMYERAQMPLPNNNGNTISQTEYHQPHHPPHPHNRTPNLQQKIMCSEHPHHHGGQAFV